MIPGPMSFPVVKRLSYTEPDAMKKLVPVWHRSYQIEAMLRSMHSKAAGTIGLGPNILWRRNPPFSYDRVRLFLGCPAISAKSIISLSKS